MFNSIVHRLTGLSVEELPSPTRATLSVNQTSESSAISVKKDHNAAVAARVIYLANALIISLLELNHAS